MRRTHNTPSAPPPIGAGQGLWRTTLAGPGRSLADAFALLDQSPHVQGLLRHPKRDLLTARVALTPEEGQGYWELTRIRDEMFVILMNCAYKEPRLEWVPGDGLVQFNFKLSGDLTYGLTHRKPLRFNRPALHIWKQPRGVDIQEWTARNSHERMVAISVSPQFIQENFFAPEASIPAQLREFLAPAVDRIDFCQSALTSRMLELTTCLLDRAPNSLASLVHREALTLELLSVAITHFETLHQHPDSNYSERQLRSLSAARAILMKQFAPAPTLEQITRAVGLPEKTLTRGFKALYGDTLFDFSIKCRMQQALLLLQRDGWSVDRVSDAVGYAHPTSFTTAFLRHFGIRPVDLKASRARDARLLTAPLRGL